MLLVLGLSCDGLGPPLAQTISRCYGPGWQDGVAAATIKSLEKNTRIFQDACIWQLPQQSCSWSWPAAFCSRHAVVVRLQAPWRRQGPLGLGQQQQKPIPGASCLKQKGEEPITFQQEPPNSPLRCTAAAMRPVPPRASSYPAMAQRGVPAPPTDSRDLSGSTLQGPSGSFRKLRFLQPPQQHSTSPPNLGSSPTAWLSPTACVGWEHIAIAFPVEQKCSNNVVAGFWVHERDSDGATAPGVGPPVALAGATSSIGLGEAPRPCFAAYGHWLWHQLPSSSEPVVQIAAGDSQILALDAKGCVWARTVSSDQEITATQVALAPIKETAEATHATQDLLEDRLGQSNVCSGDLGDVRLSGMETASCVSLRRKTYGEHVEGDGGRSPGRKVNRGMEVPETRGAPVQAQPLIVHIHVPVQVRQVACGARHNLAVDYHGGIWAWGWNAYGQCGVAALAAGGAGARTVVEAPERVQGGVLGGVPCSAVAAGLGHSLALTEAGQVAAWGWNDAGQCGCTVPSSPRVRRFAAHGREEGDGVSTSLEAAPSFMSEPQLVPLPRPPVGPSAWPLLFLEGDGVKRCRMDCEDRSEKGVVEAEDKEEDEEEVVQISSGGRHSLALAAGGRLYGWGSNSRGQLGHTTNADTFATPRLVLPFYSLSALEASCTPSVDHDLVSHGNSFQVSSDCASTLQYGGAMEATQFQRFSTQSDRAVKRSRQLGGGAGPPAMSVYPMSGKCSEDCEEGAHGQGRHGWEAAEFVMRSLGGGGHPKQLVVQAVQAGWSHTVVQCTFS